MISRNVFPCVFKILLSKIFTLADIKMFNYQNNFTILPYLMLLFYEDALTCYEVFTLFFKLLLQFIGCICQRLISVVVPLKSRETWQLFHPGMGLLRNAWLIILLRICDWWSLIHSESKPVVTIGSVRLTYYVVNWLKLKFYRWTGVL